MFYTASPAPERQRGKTYNNIDQKGLVNAKSQEEYFNRVSFKYGLLFFQDIEKLTEKLIFFFVAFLLTILFSLLLPCPSCLYKIIKTVENLTFQQ